MKIAVVGVSGILLAVLLKGQKAEYGLLISFATCVIIFFYAVSKLGVVIETIHRIQGYVTLDQSYITALVKMVGIAYIAEFSANICKDAGYSAVANQIEVFGKLSVLAVSMPILAALLETVQGLLA